MPVWSSEGVTATRTRLLFHVTAFCHINCLLGDNGGEREPLWWGEALLCICRWDRFYQITSQCNETIPHAASTPVSVIPGDQRLVRSTTHLLATPFLSSSWRIFRKRNAFSRLCYFIFFSLPAHLRHKETELLMRLLVLRFNFGLYLAIQLVLTPGVGGCMSAFTQM